MISKSTKQKHRRREKHSTPIKHHMVLADNRGGVDYWHVGDEYVTLYPDRLTGELRHHVFVNWKEVRGRDVALKVLRGLPRFKSKTAP